jgi:hypothetical protein
VGEALRQHLLVQHVLAPAQQPTVSVFIRSLVSFDFARSLTVTMTKTSQHLAAMVARLSF